jgi:hypothetical protein
MPHQSASGSHRQIINPLGLGRREPIARRGCGKLRSSFVAAFVLASASFSRPGRVYSVSGNMLSDPAGSNAAS